MILRPKQRDEKRRREMLSELKKGDKVMTGAGMLGKVSKIGEEIIGLEVAPDTVVEFHRDAIIKKFDNSLEGVHTASTVCPRARQSLRVSAPSHFWPISISCMADTPGPNT